MAESESELQLLEDSDLLIEILVRLPVKSLIRCTCVCKYWLSLIRSPHFVTKHYSTRSNLSESESDSIVSVFSPGCSISLISYHDLTFQTAFKFRPAVPYDPLRFEIYHRDIITDFSIVGPCNGLFFMQLYKGFVVCHLVRMLWNPATRELFKLPEIPSGDCTDFGFGFDAVTNDYKVVGLYGYTDTGVSDFGIVWLYSLAANSWRRVDDAGIYLTPERGNQACCSCNGNGRMHNWIMNDDFYLQPRGRLLSFDMVDEVFVETPLPSDVAPTGFLYRGGCNRMYPTVCWMKPDFQLHVWDLQQYGPTGVWNKVLNIKFPQFLAPLHMVLWKNQEIVFSNDGTLSSFNLNTQQLKSLRIPADDNVLAYTESLVSISGSVRQTPHSVDHSSDQQATQQMESLRIPADDNLASVHQTPTMDHPSDESVPLQVTDEEPEPVDDQQHLSKTTTIHPMLTKEDDDSDDSSTDSAFLIPKIPAFTDADTVYIDYETDAEFYPLRRNEVERLSNLPYCLREINKPMISNTFTF